MDISKLILQQIGDTLTGNRPSLEEFCKKYLSHHFALPMSEFHTDLMRRLQELATLRGQREVWMAPRGNAKSTILSLASVLYDICYELERYEIIVSDTHAQGKQFLSDVKLELEQNELLKRDFPHATGVGRKWSEDEIITKNNVMVTALGMRGKIRGRKFGNWRPTKIVIDDPENDESVISPRQRERTMTWVIKGALAAGVTGYTNIVIVGTVINADCLVQNLRSMAGWRSRVYSSIRTWPDRMDLWDAFEQIYYDDQTEGRTQARAFYEANKAEMDKGAVVLWAAKEDLYALMCMRCDLGHLAFESEKQNASINPAQCRFPANWFDNIWWDALPMLPGDDNRKDAAWKIYGGCDPSLGKDAKKGDYSPIVTIYWRYGHGPVYIDCDMGRQPPSATIDKILDLDTRLHFNCFAFEVNGFQSVMAAELEKKSAEKHQGLPLVMVQHTDPKVIRIERLGRYLQAGHLKFKRGSPGVKMLLKQLMMFPIGDHDDGPDALEMVMDCIEQRVARK